MAPHDSVAQTKTKIITLLVVMLLASLGSCYYYRLKSDIKYEPNRVLNVMCQDGTLGISISVGNHFSIHGCVASDGHRVLFLNPKDLSCMTSFVQAGDEIRLVNMRIPVCKGDD